MTEPFPPWLRDLNRFFNTEGAPKPESLRPRRIQVKDSSESRELNASSGG